MIIVPTYDDKEKIKNAYQPLDTAMLRLAQEYSESELELNNHFLAKAVSVLDDQLQRK